MAENNKKKIMLTGDRPTGRLHIGHYVGSLRQRLIIQDDPDFEKIFIMIADAQALTDNADDPEKVRESVFQVALEYLSIGIDPKASRMAGVDRRSLLVAVYVISGVLGGVAGVFATGSVMTVDVSNTGLLLELDAILAVVVGGTALTGGRFSLAGAAIGALLLATLDNTVVFRGVSSAATPAFKAVVIVALCLLQSATIRERLSRVRLRAPRREVTA